MYVRDLKFCLKINNILTSKDYNVEAAETKTTQIDAWIEKIKKGKYLALEEGNYLSILCTEINKSVLSLCSKAIEILKDAPNLVRLSSPVSVCGVSDVQHHFKPKFLIQTGYPWTNRRLIIVV